MMKLDPSSLRLTASYGLSIAVTIICLGSTLGRWIDRTRRLTGKADHSCSLFLGLTAITPAK